MLSSILSFFPFPIPTDIQSLTCPSLLKDFNIFLFKHHPIGGVLVLSKEEPGLEPLTIWSDHFLISLQLADS